MLFIPQVFAENRYLASRAVISETNGIPDLNIYIGDMDPMAPVALGLIISRAVSWSDFLIFTLKGAPITTTGYRNSTTNFVGIITPGDTYQALKNSGGWEVTYKQQTVLYVRFK